MSLISRLEAFAPIPLTVLLLNLPLGRFQVFWVDGPPQSMWGWPLPWMANSYMKSAANDVYLGPLALDLVMLGAVAWLLAKGLGKTPGPVRRGLAVAAWVIAAPLFLWAAFVAGFWAILAPEVITYGLWYDDWPVDHIEWRLFGRPSG